MHLYKSQIKQSALNSDELTILAPYKLAFVLGKHKMPFSSCSAFLEFARFADPNSVVFQECLLVETQLRDAPKICTNKY